MKGGLFEKLLDTYNSTLKDKDSSLEKRKTQAFFKHQSNLKTKYFEKYVETEFDFNEKQKHYYAFENERFNNSNYSLVRDRRGLEVIKDRMPREMVPFHRNGAIDFDNTLNRPSFVPEGSGPNE